MSGQVKCPIKLIFVLVSLCIFANTEAKVAKSNQFHVILEPKEGYTRLDYDQLAREIEQETGVKSLPEFKIGDANDFLFVHDDPNSVKEYENIILNRLNDNQHVHRAHQARWYPREKRGYRNRMMVDEPDQMEIKQDATNELDKIYESLKKSDPLFAKEWYIKNNGQSNGIKGLDLNVLVAWAENVTGRGIITAIMDDGIDYLHPDLSPNYSSEASYDFSSNDPFPYPRYTDDWFNSHGTRCAGEIAAAAGNGICGVGVAPNSKVAGLRMLDQPYMTDLIEAAAMSHARDLIDIYSASWGPTDDGKIVDGPRNQTMRALVDGVNKGRGGKGAIFVWASGDGGANDDCNCDGYAASMWTISINSATNDGQTASYDESCSSTLASTFSNGKAKTSEDARIATVDIYGKCTLHHSGTSAAAPEAAGVYALALEANPELTWRDVQYLTVLTSKRNHLHDPNMKHNWTINGAGLEFNHLFGFGILDAGDMVKMAKKWKISPERYHCNAGYFRGEKIFKPNEPVSITINTDSCFENGKTRVNIIEHVQAFLTIKSSRRGDLNIYLKSPMNTTSMLLGTRPKDDDSVKGFKKWPFMTTQTWGENPRGKWTLTLAMDPHNSKSQHMEGQSILTEWVLMIHGTQKSAYEQQDESLDDLSPKLAMVKREHKLSSFHIQ